jgi:hypothetical protein
VSVFAGEEREKIGAQGFEIVAHGVAPFGTEGAGMACREFTVDSLQLTVLEKRNEAGRRMVRQQSKRILNMCA